MSEIEQSVKPNTQEGEHVQILGAGHYVGLKRAIVELSGCLYEPLVLLAAGVSLQLRQATGQLMSRQPAPHLKETLMVRKNRGLSHCISIRKEPPRSSSPSCGRSPPCHPHHSTECHFQAVPQAWGPHTSPGQPLAISNTLPVSIPGLGMAGHTRALLPSLPLPSSAGPGSPSGPTRCQPHREAAPSPQPPQGAPRPHSPHTAAPCPAPRG